MATNQTKTFAIQAVPGRHLSQEEINAAHRQLEQLAKSRKQSKGKVVVALINAAAEAEHVVSAN